MEDNEWEAADGCRVARIPQPQLCFFLNRGGGPLDGQRASILEVGVLTSWGLVQPKGLMEVP